MQRPLLVLAALSLACASSAGAAPDTPPKAPPPKAPPPKAPPPRADACKPSGKVVFEIGHRAIPDAKEPTYTIKLFDNGAWARDDTSAEGKPAAQVSGCLAKAEAKKLADSLHGAPWKVTTARVHCMAMSTTFIEYQVDGKLVFTQKLCNSQTLDDKSRAALDAAAAQVEAAAKPAP